MPQCTLVHLAISLSPPPLSAIPNPRSGFVSRFVAVKAVRKGCTGSLSWVFGQVAL